LNELGDTLSYSLAGGNKQGFVAALDILYKDKYSILKEIPSLLAADLQTYLKSQNKHVKFIENGPK
jgi:hypothetical protein